MEARGKSNLAQVIPGLKSFIESGIEATESAFLLFAAMHVWVLKLFAYAYSFIIAVPTYTLLSLPGPLVEDPGDASMATRY